MAEFKAADKKEPTYDEDDYSSTNTDDLLYGHMCDIDDFLTLSPEGRRRFLKTWCEKQPPGVKNVLTALKNLELERIQEEVNFHKELAQLDMKFHNNLNELHEKRADIIRGTVEPELAEAPWMEGERQMIKESLAELASLESCQFERLLAKIKPVPADAKGIPGFWLQILKNITLTADLIEKADEPLLEKLYDIRVVQQNLEGFALEFYFEQNEYFTNDKLYKTYKYEYDCDKQRPLEYDGAYIKSCSGCNINWIKGKNLTIRSSSHRFQKKHGRMVIITRVKQKKSFFNFFKTPKISDIDECGEAEVSELRDDFELADELKNEIIPKAVLYFAGNIVYECDLYDSDTDEEGCEEQFKDESASEDADSLTH